jgi:hypothetical protein
MTRLLLTSFFILALHFSSLAQISFETQFGGSNFLGLTFNTRFEIPLDADKNHRIIPQLGVGFFAPYWEHPEAFTMPLIVQGALTYQYKRWGIGCETSGFTTNPFFGNGTGYGPTGWIDLLVYPNLNYTFGKGKWYYRVSAGAYFAYSYYTNYQTYETNLEWEGDVIPGVGFSVGYRF